MKLTAIWHFVVTKKNTHTTIAYHKLLLINFLIDVRTPGELLKMSYLASRYLFFNFTEIHAELDYPIYICLLTSSRAAKSYSVQNDLLYYGSHVTEQCRTPPHCISSQVEWCPKWHKMKTSSRHIVSYLMNYQWAFHRPQSINVNFRRMWLGTTGTTPLSYCLFTNRSLQWVPPCLHVINLLTTIYSITSVRGRLLYLYY